MLPIHSICAIFWAVSCFLRPVLALPSSPVLLSGSSEPADNSSISLNSKTTEVFQRRDSSCHVPRYVPTTFRYDCQLATQLFLAYVSYRPSWILSTVPIPVLNLILTPKKWQYGTCEVLLKTDLVGSTVGTTILTSDFMGQTAWIMDNCVTGMDHSGGKSWMPGRTLGSAGLKVQRRLYHGSNDEADGTGSSKAVNSTESGITPVAGTVPIS